MAVRFTRKIVLIDEKLCDGCGVCVPGCAEGAIQIIDGKARLVAENLCDGIGNCLGTCPQGAITIEEREADAFDEVAVEAHLDKAPIAEQVAPAPAPAPAPTACGCPGAMARSLQPNEHTASAAGIAGEKTGSAPSHLSHWPVQLTLLPPQGPLWEDADVLIAADCVAVALPELHARLIKGRTVAIGCPKLDDLQAYVQKMTHIFSHNPIKSVTVAYMEVPCCAGIIMGVQQALDASGRTDLSLRSICVGVNGTVLEERS